jgi:hypothetical protein
MILAFCKLGDGFQQLAFCPIVSASSGLVYAVGTPSTLMLTTIVHARLCFKLRINCQL